MDACLTEPAPVEIEMSRPNVTGWLTYALAATISVGVAWRLVRYLAGFPIWGDEAMLLLNILERDYAGLTHHLRFAQVAPLLFLWLEKTALVVFGASEWSVHLLPFLAGLASLLIFWRSCRSALDGRVAGLAIAILAVSYYPVRHSAEVKPYAFDLLFSTAFLGLALGHLRHPCSSRWLMGLILLTPIAVFTSYPSVFVGGAIALVLLPQMTHASGTQRSLYMFFNLALCGSFLIHYGIIAQQQIDVEEAQRTREFLRTYWKDAFPPETLSLWPLWLVKVFTGNMLAYPIGANHGGSTITFLLVLLGSISLWRAGRHSLLALCWLPFALNLIAAIPHKYPFGDSARITLHLAPFICILMAHGLGQLLDAVRSPERRANCHLALYLLLLGCGVVGLTRDLLKPYKTEHDHDVRQLVRDLRRQVAADEPVLLCHARDEEVLAEFSWYMRTQTWDLRWLPARPNANSTPSCWLVLCSNVEPSVAHLGVAGWRVVDSGVRLVPPENTKMPPMFCRWVHVVR